MQTKVEAGVVMYTCSLSYLVGWGRRITWAHKQYRECPISAKQNKSWLFDKINKTDEPQARLTKTEIKYQKWNSSYNSESEDIKKITRKYYKQWCI
jgi:hypothetical protein